MTRFSAGSVNVRTGNFVCFDTNTHTIYDRLAALSSRRRASPHRYFALSCAVRFFIVRL
jgi:hypothetical protein